MKLSFCICGLLAAACFAGSHATVLAQVPSSPPAAAAVYVLVPYEEPNSTDPHAPGVTETLAADLQAINVAVKTIAPIDHVQAVAGAADLCAANGAQGLLIAEGRYEQTQHTTMIPMMPIQFSKFPAHVELRFDEVDCHGAVVWSTHATGDKSAEGANFGVGTTATNVGSVVDAGFRNAVGQVVQSFTQVATQAPAASASPNPSSTTSAPASFIYLLIPFEQPNIADPRGPDITNSFASKFNARHLSAKVTTPIDRLTSVSSSTTLCQQNGTSAIVVTSIRLEQAKRSHAEVRLDLLDCSGHVTRSVRSEADIGYAYSPKALVKVAENAMDTALDELLAPAAK